VLCSLVQTDRSIDGGGSKHVCNVRQFVMDSTAQHLRRTVTSTNMLFIPNSVKICQLIQRLLRVSILKYVDTVNLYSFKNNENRFKESVSYFVKYLIDLR
jgi:hypothetical protein